MAIQSAIEWPSSVRILHWATALLLLVSFTLVLTWDIPESRAVQLGLVQAHRVIGLCVLAAAVVRLLARAATHAPPHQHAKWVGVAAWFGHAAMYAALLALPMLGWLLTNARGKPVHFLFFDLPLLIARDRDLAESLEELHGLFGWALLALIGLHIGATLWHQWRLRDDVFRSMLGGRLYDKLFG